MHFERGTQTFNTPTPFYLSRYLLARVAFQFPPELLFPSIALPLTRPVYKEPPALKVIWSPFNLPFAI
jgi:hypothetical protein